jgi:DNA-binding NarL/FixJ family response regulator
VFGSDPPSHRRGGSDSNSFEPTTQGASARQHSGPTRCPTGTAVGRLKVVVVDPQPIMVIGLRSVLLSDAEIELVGTCQTGAQALEVCVEDAPALVITEIVLPDMAGSELCRAIKRSAPGTEVLILTTRDDNASVFGAIGAGASAYVLKDISPDNFLRAVHAVRRGQTMVHPAIARRMLDKFSLITRDGNGGLLLDGVLTEREAEILAEVAKGLTNKEIAHKLLVAESTVKSRLRIIFSKIDVHDRAQAAAFAIRGGYVN